MKLLFRPAASLVLAGVALAGGAGVVMGAANFGAPHLIATAIAAETASAPTTRPRAAGGRGILGAAEHAQVVAIGHVQGLRKVDRSGWAAGFVPDLVLQGEARVGETIDMAWEELAVSRRVRFDNGDRLLVVLEDLPNMSLWAKRFPPGAGPRPVLAIAAAGDAFLRDPDPFTTSALEHYLAVTPRARGEAGGMARLAEIVVLAATPVAIDALEQLEARQDLASVLGADGSATLLEAARSEKRDPAVRSRALLLAASRRLPGTLEAARSLAEPGSPLRVTAWRALATLPDGVRADEARALLEDSDPELRTVGLLAVTGPEARAAILEVARKDSVPEVRAAAGVTLVRRFGVDAIDDALSLLADPSSKVRGTVAAEVGRLGAAAVDPLVVVVDTAGEDAAAAAVVGLAKAGPSGASAIVRIAASHSSDKVRAVAELALGHGPDNHKH